MHPGQTGLLSLEQEGLANESIPNKAEAVRSANSAKQTAQAKAQSWEASRTESSAPTYIDYHSSIRALNCPASKLENRIYPRLATSPGSFPLIKSTKTRDQKIPSRAFKSGSSAHSSSKRLSNLMARLSRLFASSWQP